jgi:DNA-binding response OmpR family regulator
VKTERKRILCVDDDGDTCELLQFILSDANFEVITADSVTAALELARMGGFDLYILDQNYMDGTGAELCRKIREFDQRSPVIFYSGGGLESEQQACLKAGAQAYLIKPKGLDEIIQTVNQLIGTPLHKLPALWYKDIPSIS